MHSAVSHSSGSPSLQSRPRSSSSSSDDGKSTELNTRASFQHHPTMNNASKNTADRIKDTFSDNDDAPLPFLVDDAMMQSSAFHSLDGKSNSMSIYGSPSPVSLPKYKNKRTSTGKKRQRSESFSSANLSPKEKKRPSSESSSSDDTVSINRDKGVENGEIKVFKLIKKKMALDKTTLTTLANNPSTLYFFVFICDQGNFMVLVQNKDVVIIDAGGKVDDDERKLNFYFFH